MKRIAQFAVLLFFPFTVLSQPATIVENISVQPGQTTTFNISYLGSGSGVTIGQFDINIGNPDVTVTNITCNSPLFLCALPGDPFTTLFFDLAGSEVPDTPNAVTVTIDVSAMATPQLVPVTLSAEQYLQPGMVDVPPNGSMNGSINIFIPMPAYESTPDPLSTITFDTVIVGNTPDQETLSITNSGFAGTTLTGSCTVSGTDAARFSIVSSNAFSLATTDPAAMIVTECDSNVIGNYTASLDCTHDGGPDGEDTTGTASYPLSCQVIEDPALAIFASTPVAGSTINFSPGAVLAGTPLPDQVLTFENQAMAGLNDLDLACSLTGDGMITVAPDISVGTVVAAAGSTDQTFSCDTSIADTVPYTADYSCVYGIDGDGMTNDGSASYTVVCDVSDFLFEDGFEE